MKVNIIISLLCYVSFISCESKKETKGATEKSKWDIMFEKYQTMDSLFKSGSFSDFRVDYYTNDSTSNLQLTLIFDKKQTMLIKYPSFDITGNFIGYSELFFNEKRKPFAIAKLIGEKSISLTLFDIDKGYFYADTLIDKQIFLTKELKSYEDFNYQCEIVKVVDNLMHRFSSLGRYSSTECLNSLEDIEVNADSVPLYSNKSGSESSIVTYLRRGTRLKYVIADTTTVNHKNQDSYFLKVSTIDKKKSGWVFYISEDFIDVEELDVE